ncbi:signal peptidase I [Sphingomonas sp. ID0503]|uniref:signal peptidase I n=1 Tax=Sphingomonas sp. ID0503 TaxID=3399691 RepID=UPI003AFB629F
MLKPRRARSTKPKKEETFLGNLRFTLIMVIVVVLVRSLIFAPFSIPSESMVPRLLVGDHLIVTKWDFGWSRYSFPFGIVPIKGRIWGSPPERGQVVVFKAPPGNSSDYIKRVIGLPGDQIQMKNGRLFINGTGVPKVRIADLVIPFTPTMACRQPSPPRYEKQDEAAGVCRYTRFRETLPNGKSYEVLDMGYSPQADDTGVYIVPEGHYFMMGDNRDNSADSRFEAMDGGGIGFVPFENLLGPARVMYFSTDGNAEWLKPWTWFTAARWDRIGGTF